MTKNIKKMTLLQADVYAFKAPEEYVKNLPLHIKQLLLNRINCIRTRKAESFYFCGSLDVT